MEGSCTRSASGRSWDDNRPESVKVASCAKSVEIREAGDAERLLAYL